jgi:hypothetical protein
MEDDSGPELVVVVADADAEKLLESVLRRGVEGGCLRSFRWVIRRDPGHDASVCQSPLRALAGVRPSESKLLVIFDHHGSGRETTPARDLEADIVERLVRAGFPETGVACILLEPELEAVIVPAWDRVAELLAARRKLAPPTHEQVLARVRSSGTSAEAWSKALSEQPKECLDGLLRILRLRHEPSLFAEMGRHVSLRTFKQGGAAARLSACLLKWFGA